MDDFLTRIRAVRSADTDSQDIYEIAEEMAEVVDKGQLWDYVQNWLPTDDFIDLMEDIAKDYDM